MGRPRLENKRREQVSALVTDSEFRLITAAALQSNVSRGEILRQALRAFLDASMGSNQQAATGR